VIKERTDRLRGLLEHVRLGQVSNEKLKREALRHPIYLLACFGQKFGRTDF
jgi:hypothetical protein